MSRRSIVGEIALDDDRVRFRTMADGSTALDLIVSAGKYRRASQFHVGSPVWRLHQKCLDLEKHIEELRLVNSAQARALCDAAAEGVLRTPGITGS